MKAMLIAICAILVLSGPTFAQEDDDGGDDGGAPEQSTEGSDEPDDAVVEPNETEDGLLNAYNTACAADKNSSECKAAASKACEGMVWVACVPDASGVKHVLVNTQ